MLFHTHRWFFCYAKTYRGTADRSKPKIRPCYKNARNPFGLRAFFGASSRNRDDTVSLPEDFRYMEYLVGLLF